MSDADGQGPQPGNELPFGERGPEYCFYQGLSSGITIGYISEYIRLIFSWFEFVPSRSRQTVCDQLGKMAHSHDHIQS